MSEQIELSRAQDHKHLSICHDCDVLLMIPGLGHHEKARCPRCAAVLDQGGAQSIRRLLPLTISGFILIILANLFPLITMNANGQIVDSSLLSATVALWLGEQRLLSLLVFVTTFLTPLVQLLTYAWLLIPMSFGRILPLSDSVLRLSHHSVPWNMMEIFLLGFIIAVVKLGEDALIIPGPSLYAFVALIVLMTVLNSLFDPASVREEMHARKQERLQADGEQTWLT